MDPAASPKTPDAVLFACSRNRVRSPMAEVLLKQIAGDRIYVDSCGLTILPRGEDEDCDADPLAIEVMAELGCELSGHQAKTFEDLRDASFDLVISFNPQAQHHAVETTRGRAVEIEYWPIVDPTLTKGTREVRLAAYRELRETLAKRIVARFGL